MKPLRKCKRNNQNKETKTNLRQNITCWFFKEYRKKTYTYGNKTKESKKNCSVVVLKNKENRHIHMETNKKGKPKKLFSCCF